MNLGLSFYSLASQQPKEVVHVNGERMENESDEEESEEGEDTEEDEELVTEDRAKASQEGPTIASVSQVGIQQQMVSSIIFLHLVI